MIRFTSARFMSLVVVVTALMMSSCSKKVQILWYNDTGETISIFIVDLRKARPDALIERGGKAITDNRQPIKIQTQTRAWLYDQLPVTEGIATRESPRVCKIWIRQDGVLYYLPPAAEGPSDKFIWQPGGFPVRPRPILP